MSNLTTGSASKPVMLGAQLTPSPLTFMDSLWIHHRGARTHLQGDMGPSQGIRGSAILFLTPRKKAVSEKKSKIIFLQHVYAAPAGPGPVKYDSEDQLELHSDTHSGCCMEECCCVVYFSKCRFTEVVACREERGRRMIVPCDWSTPSLSAVVASDSACFNNSLEKTV